MKLAVATLCLACLTGCVPWTVRPIESAKQGQADARFDAQRFVDSIWDSKLLPELDRQATDLASALQREPAKAGAAVPVKATARVLKVNTGSSNGTLLLDLLPADGKADAVLQIGPEVRGSSLRDATTVISFSQFVNQIDFANVSTQLNRRAVRVLPPSAELARAAGRSIEFTGAFTSVPGELPTVTPVRFRWVEAGK